MGGFLSFLGEEGVNKVASKAEGSSLGRAVMSLAGNKEYELGLTAAGKLAKTQIEEFHRIRLTALGEYTKNTDALKSWHQNDPVAMNAHPMKTSTINDFHNYATSNNHPVQNVTSKILSEDIDPKTGVSRNADLTMEQYNLKARGDARLKGIAGSFGDHYQNLAPVIAEHLEHSDPRIQMNARRVSEIVANEIKDTQVMKDRTGKYSPQSSSAVKMNTAFSQVNAFRKKLMGDSSSEIPMLRTDPTYYRPEDTERIAGKYFRMMQIPLVAIPHIGQYFHLPMTAPIEAMGKALLGYDKEEMQKTVEASGIFSNTQWDVIHSDILARTGKVAKWTNSPTAASIISKSIHQPTFNWMRLKQLSAAGSVGFHSAIYWAKGAMEGDKRAIAELIQMGIDPEEVSKQGGKLNEEQLSKGVYHFVNDRFFFQKTLDNSLWQNKNMIYRGAFMYHSFVNSEVTFLGKELSKMIKVGDYKGFAQFVGTLGILFPAVAPLLKSAELLGRTGSMQQAQAEVSKDYNNLSFGNGPGAFMTTYIDMLSHIGAMGAFKNYTSAIMGDRLANSLVGPMIGTMATDITDLVKAGMGKSGKPLGRDVLEQTVPVVGKPLSHQLFPTTKESSSGRPHKPSRPHRPKRR